MFQVNVVSEGGRYYAEVVNQAQNYRFVGDVFEGGRLVEGRFEGEVAAFEDAKDWRAKLKKAGLKVE